MDITLPILNRQQQSFVDYYVGGMNKLEACQSAGYKACKSYAYQLMEKPEINQAISVGRLGDRKINPMVHYTPELIMQGIYKETSNDNANTRLKAWELLAKIKGLFIEQKTETNQVTFSLNMDNPKSIGSTTEISHSETNIIDGDTV